MNMGDAMVLAVPSLAEGGLEAERSEHFGRSACFTIVEIADGAVTRTRVVANAPHEHGGCLGPVDLLASNGVNALVVAGIGGRPLAGCIDAGIDVYFDDRLPLVTQVVDAMAAGSVPRIDPGAGCGCNH